MTNGSEIKAFLRKAAEHSGEECLIWPFSRNKKTGYASINRQTYGEAVVSRYVCQQVNGAAPTPKHQAAHVCGKGHLGCVSGGHLQWKTQKQNSADTITHGTVTRGEKAAAAKLTEAQVQAIHDLRGKMKQRDVGAIFGIHHKHVSRIQRGVRWAHSFGAIKEVRE